MRKPIPLNSETLEKAWNLSLQITLFLEELSIKYLDKKTQHSQINKKIIIKGSATVLTEVMNNQYIFSWQSFLKKTKQKEEY